MCRTYVYTYVYVCVYIYIHTCLYICIYICRCFDTFFYRCIVVPVKMLELLGLMFDSLMLGCQRFMKP